MSQARDPSAKNDQEADKTPFFLDFLNHFPQVAKHAPILQQTKIKVGEAEQGLVGQMGRVFNEYPLSYTHGQNTYHAVNPEQANKWIALIKSLVLANVFDTIVRNDQAAVIIKPEFKQEASAKLRSFIQEIIKQADKDMLLDKREIQAPLVSFLGLEKILRANQDDLPKLQALKFQLLYSYCTQLIAANITDALLKEPDMDVLAVAACNRFLSDTLSNSLMDHIKWMFFKDETEEATPSVLNQYDFVTKNSYLFSGGPYATNSILMAMASQLLRMPNDDFFKKFKAAEKPTAEEKKWVNQTLSQCVEDGIKLHQMVSNQTKTGLFSLSAKYQAKSVEEIQRALPKLLQQEVGGVSDLVPLQKSCTPVRVKEELSALTSLDSYFTEFALDMMDILKQDEVCFIATSATRNTAFFSRIDEEGKKFYYLIDAAGSFSSGKIEVYDNLKTLMGSLLNQWGKDKEGYVDIMAYTLNTQVMRARKEVSMKVSPDKEESKANTLTFK